MKARPQLQGAALNGIVVDDGPALALSPTQMAVLERELQRRSCLYFATQNLSGPPESPYNGRFIAGEHHFEWDDLASSSKRACILAPRDHGKSMYWNKAFPIWKGAFGRPGELGYIFSVNQEKAMEMLKLIAEEIVTNPKLQHLAPRGWEQKWNKHNIKLTTGVEIRARGFGVSVRGGHPHWIIGDDMLSDDNITSDLIRTKAIDFFLSAITNMCVPGGQIVVVGTPLHSADLYSHLRKNGVYKMWEKPALNPTTGKALWPARYNAPLLAERRAEIGSVRFTREFLVQPYSDEMSLFPGYLFEGKPVQQHMLKLGQTGAYWDALGVTSRYMGVDIAISATTGADFFVIFTLGRDKDGNRWVCDIERHHGLGFQGQLDKIVSAARRLDPALIFVEANQMQRVWGDELIRTTDLPIKKFITTGAGKGTISATSQTSNKHSLEKGIPSMVPLLENKKFRIPRGDAYSVEMTDIWISEMRSMSFVDGQVQCIGAHDDTTMAAWIADQALRRGGFSVSFGPEEDDEQRRAPPPTPTPAGAALPATAHVGHNGAEGVVEGVARGDLGASDPSANALWAAIPFFR